MKLYAAITTAFWAAQLLGTTAAVSTCSTFYGSKATTKVPTSTTTKTQTVTYATRITTVTRTTTETVHTFTRTIGKSTTTIPTGPQFTPIISAKNLAGVTGKRRRRDSIKPHPPSNLRAAKALRAALASTTTTKYPQSVICTRTLTSTFQQTKPYSTSIRSATTQLYATTTTSVAVATVHAACQGTRNLISRFHNHPLAGANYNKAYEICDFTPGSSSESGHSGGYPCMDARACCEVAQDYFSGWRFDNATGQNRCYVLLGNDLASSGGWVFYDDQEQTAAPPGSPLYFFGNGATYGGQYGGQNPDPGCVRTNGCLN